jgi:DNA-binding MarR family transcriptional regulator
VRGIGPRDRIDLVQQEWSEAWPELPVNTLSITGRMRFILKYMEQELDAALGEYGLTHANLLVLATLRRRLPPYQASQRVLMAQLGLTSGTISVRIDRLAALGLVERLPDERDRRGSIVSLTAEGLSICETVIPKHTANEERLLLSLTSDEQELLSGLLRKLMLGFEGEAAPGTARYLGLGLEAPHVAYEMRRAVGLPPLAGLLVESVMPGGAGDGAGIKEGDLLVSAAGTPLHSVATLYHAISEAQPQGTLDVVVVRGTELREVPLPLEETIQREATEDAPPRRKRRRTA